MAHPPDPSLADSFGNGIFFVILVAFNVWTRVKGSKSLAGKIDKALDAKVAEMETAIKLLRESIDKAIEQMVRLQVRIEQTEKADDRLQVEMHSLVGRLDATNQKYSEILTAFKSREKTAVTGQKLEEEPPVTGKVAFKEEKKR
jgi:chromosome segregation ATPase